MKEHFKCNIKLGLEGASKGIGFIAEPLPSTVCQVMRPGLHRKRNKSPIVVEVEILIDAEIFNNSSKTMLLKSSPKHDIKD